MTAAPLTHRLGRFMTDENGRHILLQEKSTIRIADIMNDGKILLVNLSKGDVGEDQSHLLRYDHLLRLYGWRHINGRKYRKRIGKDFYLVRR